MSSIANMPMVAAISVRSVFVGQNGKLFFFILVLLG
ncbi:hypothetical protein LCGC14_0485040 [marine sediment metagenome]|uniref:Uncharacterized protein n=1 Tax=marine sediment metagenome TaxID=412755 RepID=A0A0F9UVC8_9ZZZZ